MEGEGCGALVVTERFMHVGGKNQHWEKAKETEEG